MYGDNTSVQLEERKLFVGGLGWDTTEKQLSEYFNKYGEVESISVKTNPNTGRSRGFAFIVFVNEDTADQILKVSEHIINGRKVDAKKAIARTGKLFVGGLKAEISNDDVRNHFNQFGRVVDLEVPFDKQRNQRKGFCFVTFEQEQVANELLKNPQQTINGFHVDLRKAQPKMEYAPIGVRPGEYGGPRGNGRGSYGYTYGTPYGNNYRNLYTDLHFTNYDDSGYGNYRPGYDSYSNGYGGGYGDYQSYSDVSYSKGRGQQHNSRQAY